MLGASSRFEVANAEIFRASPTFIESRFMGQATGLGPGDLAGSFDLIQFRNQRFSVDHLGSPAPSM